MAELTTTDIFGDSVTVVNNPTDDEYKLVIDLKDFQNTGSGGQITEGLGISNLGQFTAQIAQGNKAVALLYAIVLLASQNQATNLNDDPSQSLFVSEGGKNLGSGSRDGQIRRVIGLNLFSYLNINTLPDIDDVGHTPTISL